VQANAVAVLLFTGLAIGGGRDALAWCDGEYAQARTTAREINEQWPLRPRDDPLNDRINRIGGTLARHADKYQHSDWRFRIIRNLAPYAYAIGGGHVYLTEGVASFARDESELAAVVAHEMGHQLAGHFCKARWSPSDLLSTLRLPSLRYKPLGAAQLIIDSDKEREADAIAVELLRTSGYDPRSMLEVARRLPSTGGPDPRRISALEARLTAPPKTAQPQQSP
jgi:beta-barrel assembly-enhancing protease